MKENKLIEAIEKVSFLPEGSKKVLRILVKYNTGMPVKFIAEETKMSASHVHNILYRLYYQNIVSKVKTENPIMRIVIRKSYVNKLLKTYENSSLDENVV